MTYTLYQLGPDDRSTYPECWGSHAASPGHKIAEAKTLAALVDAVSALSHDNWSLRGPGDKSIASSRAEFFDLPRVKNVLKWAKDGRAEA